MALEHGVCCFRDSTLISRSDRAWITMVVIIVVGGNFDHWRKRGRVYLLANNSHNFLSKSTIFRSPSSSIFYALGIFMRIYVLVVLVFSIFSISIEV